MLRNMILNYKILDIKIRPVPQDKLTPFPVVKYPCQQGEYSVSSEGIFEQSSSRMRYLTELSSSEFPFSLNDCEENDTNELSNFKIRDLDHMFFFLKSYEKKFFKRTSDLQFPQLDADIVCTREILRLIMCTPYERYDNWKISASMYRNTIYLTQVKIQNSKSTLVAHDYLERILKANWLKKLRLHLMDMDENNVQPNASKQSQNGQYYSVFSMEISGMRLLFDAPVLAMNFSKQLIGQPKSFVELQLRADTMNRAEWTNHNLNEVLKWWGDCFLVGIENIHIAYHDRNSVVHKIKCLTVRELWKECDTVWSPNVCGNFLASFLSKIKNIMADINCANTIYLFEYDAKNSRIVYKVISERSELMFIPDWYQTMM